MLPARFITLEGGEGSGKSTQAALLADAIGALGIPVLRTREPGGAPGAERLRELLPNGGLDWSPLAETLLHFTARAEHVEKVIRPALAAGTWVVCDRFSDSTMAYQGYGQGADRAMIASLARMIGLQPDLTLVLDVPPTIAASRRQLRGGTDRYEQLDPTFHARVAEGFREIARSEPRRCVLIAGQAPPEAVHRQVMQEVRTRLGLG